MIRNLIKKLFNSSKSTPDYLPKQEVIDWESIVETIKGHLGSHCIYLELKEGGWSKLENEQDSIQVTGVAVVYAADGVEIWDTEAPAKHKAEELSKVLGRDLPILLSREFQYFVGYYVYINT